MSDREPTNAELIAAAVSIAIAARQLIEGTDRTSYRVTGETLHGLHEGMAVAGGSLMRLADNLGLTGEVDRLVKRGQDRLAAFNACSGLEGRA